MEIRKCKELSSQDLSNHWYELLAVLDPYSEYLKCNDLNEVSIRMTTPSTSPPSIDVELCRASDQVVLGLKFRISTFSVIRTINLFIARLSEINLASINNSKRYNWSAQRDLQILNLRD